jgi:hypothetical protein
MQYSVINPFDPILVLLDFKRANLGAFYQIQSELRRTVCCLI